MLTFVLLRIPTDGFVWNGSEVGGAHAETAWSGLHVHLPSNEAGRQAGEQASRRENMIKLARYYHCNHHHHSIVRISKVTRYCSARMGGVMHAAAQNPRGRQAGRQAGRLIVAHVGDLTRTLYDSLVPRR